MTDFDLVIVGGGIAGASLGAVLASRARVAIIEAEDHAARHSTGRSAAFWLASYGGPAVVPLTLASRPLFDSHWPGTEFPTLRRRGAIFIARSEAELQPVVAEDPDNALGRERLDRHALEQKVPGLRAGWEHGLAEWSCADIDVAALHQACLARFRCLGGQLYLSAPLTAGRRSGDIWSIEAGGQNLTAATIVNAAGAWADRVAMACGVPAIGIQPKRRTMVQLRVGRNDLRHLPQVLDSSGGFYFKGEGDSSIWLSPHDEVDCEPCDAAPEDVDVATAIDRFQGAVDWPVQAVERKWAGLRTFAPDRLPVYGFDPAAEGFFWCAGQGGFGIQTAPAAAHLTASLLLGEVEDPVRSIDPSHFAPDRFR